jgi:hypothetical protein
VSVRAAHMRSRFVKSGEESATFCVATAPDVVTNTHQIIPANHGATHRVPTNGESTVWPWRMIGLSFLLLRSMEVPMPSACLTCYSRLWSRGVAAQAYKHQTSELAATPTNRPRFQASNYPGVCSDSFARKKQTWQANPTSK